MIITLNNTTLMTDDIWKRMKYMTPKDSWGDKTKISYMLVQSLENMRISSGNSITLTCEAYSTGGHTTSSEHYKGRAADIRIKSYNLMDMYVLAEKFQFTGIGLYPFGQNGPFIHVDVRDFNPFDKQSRWIAIGNPNNWTYIELNGENLKKYCI